MSFSRVRSEGAFVPKVRSYSWTKVGGSSGVTHVGTESCGNRRVMTDYVTPGFKKLSGEGAIVNHPMESLYEAYDLNGSASGRWVGYPYAGSILTIDYNNVPWSTGGVSGDLPSIHALCLSPPSISSLETSAITGAFAKLNDFDMLALVTIKEFKKTLALAPDLFMGFLQLLADYQKLQRALKGGKLKKARKAWGQLYTDSASLWLAFRYGVTPTLMELEGLHKAITARKRPERQTFRAQAEYQTSTTTARTSLAIPEHFKCNVSDVYNLKQTVRCTVLAEFSPVDGETNLREQLGFSWRAVPISIWEGLPLSFVVDWVVNVGDVLTALNPNPNWVVRGAVVTAKQLSSCARSLVSVTELHTGWKWSASGAETSNVDKRMRRLTSASEIGAVIFPKMNLKRDLDAIALLIGRVRTTAARI